MKRFRFLRNRDRRDVPTCQKYRLPVSASLQKVIEERKVHAKMRYEKKRSVVYFETISDILDRRIPGVDMIFPVYDGVK